MAFKKQNFKESVIYFKNDSTNTHLKQNICQKSVMKCFNKRCSVKNKDSIVIFCAGLLFVKNQRCRYKHLL